jgi:GrpB-like predicted nucleotidyltransferase (UPF0157 family)
VTSSQGQRALTEREIRDYTVGDLQPLTGQIQIADYNPVWSEIFRREAESIRRVLGSGALCAEHTGSTAVPGLAAKPVIDIALVVADSAAEETYVAGLESIGYVLRIREPAWFEHRMLKKLEPAINLHVFSLGYPELDRILVFRDWLRNSPADRELYARTKRNLAKLEWKYVQNYADAKCGIIEKTMKRALKVSPNPNPH